MLYSTREQKERNTIVIFRDSTDMHLSFFSSFQQKLGRLLEERNKQTSAKLFSSFFLPDTNIVGQKKKRIGILQAQ